MSSHASRSPTWTGLEGWRVPRTDAQWDPLQRWISSFERAVASSAQSLEEAVARWDASFQDFGGDPARRNWSTFRLLRLDREEDWSDWLADLVENSQSGHFAAQLFGRGDTDATRWCNALAEREIAAQQYRADIVIRFERDEWLSLEVKVGDRSLAKTVETALALRGRYFGTLRGDFLLLLEEDVTHWEAVKCGLHDRATRIAVITWHDVARALRMALLQPDSEPAFWRAWAYTYLGAIEQHLLRFTPVLRASRMRARPPSAGHVKRLEYLKSMEPLQ